MLPPFNLKVCFNVKSDDLEFSVLKIRKLVNDKVRIVSANIVKKHRDLVIYSSLEIAMTMSAAHKLGRNVVMVTDFRSVRIFLSLKRLLTNVDLNCIVVLLILCARQSSH